MEPAKLDRRAFHKFALAALGGLATGAALLGAEDDKDKPKKKDVDKPLLLQEPHICRGLNQCKNKGKGEKNDCAGQGACATAKAHTCKGENDCAGLGGCGAKPGENKCKGMGECAVPLKKDAVWEKARKNFEEAMKKAGKKFGDAPKKP
jgi:hypothetical protein